MDYETQSIDGQEWMQATDYARVKGVALSVILHHVKNGRIKHRRIGRALLIPVSELTAWEPQGRVGRPRKAQEER